MSNATYNDALLLAVVDRYLGKLTARMNLIHVLMIVVCLVVVLVFFVQAGFALYSLTKMKKRPELPTELVIQNETKGSKRSKSSKSSKRNSSKKSSKSSRRSEKSEESSRKCSDSARRYPSKEAKVQIDFEKEPEKKKKGLEMPPTIEMAAVLPPAYQYADPASLRPDIKQGLMLAADMAPTYPGNISVTPSLSTANESSKQSDIHTVRTSVSTPKTAIPLDISALRTATEPPSRMHNSDTKTAVAPATPTFKTAIGPSTPTQSAK